MACHQKISLLLLIFSSPVVLLESCDSRCLAKKLIDKKEMSAPQNAQCSVTVNVTLVQYETLTFDTKEMQMSSRVLVKMRWTDPELAWDDTISSAASVMLPVHKIWTPGLVLDNVIDVTTKTYTDDVAVKNDGTVNYAVVLFIAVSCDISLFTYPFVTGDCGVAINGWNQSDCDLSFVYLNNATMFGSSQCGEWNTESVAIQSDQQAPSRNYLSVTLSINPFCAVVTLILPSVLIMVADLVSFSLPIQGGERNNLKVTLVLSFTMFLLILNDRLSSGGRCAPLLHYHFCFCLVNLVLSMVMSLVLTHLMTADGLLTYRCSKRIERQNTHLDQDEDAGVIVTTKTTELEMASIQKTVNVLENINQTNQRANSNEVFVDFLDKLCFLFFLFVDIIYVITVCVIVTKTEMCKSQNPKIWITLVS
ncbi:zinc-activated ligand-gated ion channel [Danio aesculapii]|uniref:zinc-activated ligand-gated ion channel n=1 Tax=Danio aesculapii TaxID=1142201 RepID=UPI0024C09CED|nr:zinc-activated ligand-gated ion channel [Danio aesculapii]